MLEVRNLRKEYGSLTAVQGISFSLNPGDILGFIGSNGAGKTTTIRMLATLLEPTMGTARLNGADIRTEPMEVRRMLGYMPDFFGLYDDVKVWEYLDFFAAIYKVPPRKRPGIIDQVLEMTDLIVKKDAFVQSLSRGMQQRLCLARCLVHDPALLLLDEPASGLDPRARSDLKDLIVSLAKMGKIVIVSSHILPELSDFCNMVGIIERGEMLAFGPVNEVVQKHTETKILHARFLNRLAEAMAFLENQPYVTNVSREGEDTAKVDFAGDSVAQVELVRTMIQHGFELISLREEQIDLEDIFLKLTTGAVN